MKLSQKIFPFFKKSSELKKYEDTINVSEKKEMIQGIEELEQTSVKEVMVPRIDVSFISDTATKEDLLQTINEEGYSRYPVYFETIDNVVGILYVKDIVGIIPTKPLEIRKCMRKPYFVPDTKRLDELLREFKKRKVHIAVAIDEYGGVSGIVTMEDILEVIIGDIQDEFDDDEDEDIIEMGDGIFLCDARTSIDEVNERLNLNLPEIDAETIGGFVFEQFGRIPTSQEKVTYDSMDFIVQEIDGHKINSVKIVMKRG